jgi:hypothetical protein
MVKDWIRNEKFYLGLGIRLIMHTEHRMASRTQPDEPQKEISLGPGPH